MTKFPASQFVGKIDIFFLQNAKWVCIYGEEFSTRTKIQVDCRKQNSKSAQNFRIAVFWTLQDSMAKFRNSLWLPTLIYKKSTIFITRPRPSLQMLHRWRSQFFFSGIKAGEVTDQLFFNDWWNNAHGRWVWPEPKPKKTRKQKEKWLKKKKEQHLLILLIARRSRKKRFLFSAELLMHEFALLTQKTHFVFLRLFRFRFFERYPCCWGEKKKPFVGIFFTPKFFFAGPLK